MFMCADAGEALGGTLLRAYGCSKKQGSEE